MSKGLPQIKSDFFGKSIISLKQFDPESLEKLFTATSDFKAVSDKKSFREVLKGKVVTLLFYEPSSRTRASFDAAVKYLGGNTLVVENPQQFSSVVKGETFEDTLRVFETYSDAIVLRHPEKGASEKATKIVTSIPIINAGDGVGEHPTQALLDLFTIKEHAAKLSGLKGLLVGDLKNGRTVHSLLDGIGLYKNNEIYLLSPESLKLPEEYKSHAKEEGLKLHEIKTTDEIPNLCDFWYWTRVQKERLTNIDQYQKTHNQFILSAKLAGEKAGKNTIFMHPLPRVGEIETEVDRDPRAVYFRSQIQNGLYLRMAILTLLLNPQ